jgi:hypothetical protein
MHSNILEELAVSLPGFILSLNIEAVCSLEILIPPKILYSFISQKVPG